jgi:hypothetical protein
MVRLVCYAEYIRRVREALPSIPPNNPQLLLLHLIRNTLEERYRSAFTLSSDDWKNHEIVIRRLNTACEIGSDMAEVFATDAFHAHARGGQPAHSGTLLKWTEYLLLKLRHMQPEPLPDRYIFALSGHVLFTPTGWPGFRTTVMLQLPKFMDKLRSLNTNGVKRTRDDVDKSVAQSGSTKHFRKRRVSQQHGSTPAQFASAAPPFSGSQMSDASKGNPSKA